MSPILDAVIQPSRTALVPDGSIDLFKPRSVMNTFDTYVQPLLDLVGRYPAAAAFVVFLAALSEAIPVVGAMVPGSALVVGLGALVGLGHLPFWPILIAAILGAIFGDGLSYWFGRRYKAEALAMWPLSRYPAMVSASEAFFRRHGGKSVAIARFTPVVRAFVPLIAGISGMTPGHFYMVNVLSAVAWAPLHVLPGAALGASLGVLGAMSGHACTACNCRGSRCLLIVDRQGDLANRRGPARKSTAKTVRPPDWPTGSVGRAAARCA